jgi:hypothetical protein
VLDILQNCKEKKYFPKITKEKVRLITTTKGLLIFLYLDNKEEFIKLASFEVFRKQAHSVGSLKVIHSQCHTNDSNYVKLYVSKLGRIKSKSDLAKSITDILKVIPIIVSIDRDPISNFPNGWGFVIVLKVEAHLLLENTTLSCDGQRVITFAKCRRKANN